MFSEVPVIYIADGHHRASSSALLAKKRTAENPNHTGNEPYNFFTAALFADDELKIYGYHRIIQGLNQYSPDSFIIELRKKFNVYEIEKAPENIRKKTLTLYTGKKWYCIDLSNHITNPNDTVSKLDVSLLSDYILSPILGIKDIRNDKRISFVSGTKSTEEIEKIVDNGNLDAAFCLSPISFEELITVADMGEVMPPKSTWIEPKLESGLLTYSIEE